MTLRVLTLIVSVCLTVLAVLLIGTWIAYDSAEHRLQEAYQTHYDSYLLADELRQSSDDLTRLARTYVATGDAKYETQYGQVLAIRNGEQPRPQAYHRIYWDFVAATGQKPRPDGEAIALEARMRQAGFTEEEFALLREAQANSDGLVGLETRAMNAMKGRFADGQGGYTKTGDPDPALARQLMFSPEYHQYKAQIMGPIDAFFGRLEQRTSTTIAEAQDQVSLLGTLIFIILGLLVVGAVVVMTVLRMSMVRPLVALKEAMTALADQDTSVTIPALDRKDEIGEMAFAADVFKRSLQDAEELRRQQEEQSAAAEQKRVTAMRQMADQFEQAVGGVVSRVHQATESLGRVSSVLSANNDTAQTRASSVANAAEQASMNVQSVAAATEELAASVREVSQQAQQSATVAGNAADKARETTSTVQGLAEAANRIGEVVVLINTIADQTNLLALNATIEAARAGDAGKGFAVVAGEVKSLATQTGRATQEIQGQVQAIQSETREAVEAIQGIRAIIDQINEYVAAISAAVQEQEATTGEIARSIDLASQSSRDAATNVAEVSRSTEETGQTVQEVSSASGNLSREVEALSGEVHRFLSNIRQG